MSRRTSMISCVTSLVVLALLADTSDACHWLKACCQHHHGSGSTSGPSGAAGPTQNNGANPPGDPKNGNGGNGGNGNSESDDVKAAKKEVADREGDLKVAEGRLDAVKGTPKEEEIKKEVATAQANLDAANSKLKAAQAASNKPGVGTDGSGGSGGGGALVNPTVPGANGPSPPQDLLAGAATQVRLPNEQDYQNLHAKIGKIRVGENQRHIMKLIRILAPDDKAAAIDEYFKANDLQDFVDQE